MITFERCAAFAGLAPNEMFLGAAPSARHHSLLSSYRLNLWRGPKVVCGLIVSDIRTFLDLGASKRAADLLLVLREFLSDYPEASLAATGKTGKGQLPKQAGASVYPWPDLFVAEKLCRQPVLTTGAMGAL